MSKIDISSVIAIVGLIGQAIIFLHARKRQKEAKRYYEQAEEELAQARLKRKAAKTILDFAEVWRTAMSEDERLNLVIEWHQRLVEANIIINVEGGKDV